MQHDPQTLFQEAIALHRAGRHRDALRLCEQILARQPSNVHAHNLGGAAALSLGDLPGAENAFRDALGIEPQQFEARANLGRVQAMRGDLAGAEKSYREALERQPGSVPLINALGLLLKDTGRVDEALSAFRRALEADPADPSTLNNLGVALTESGDTTQAMENFRAALERQPQHVNAMCNLAVALIREEQTEEALQWCERALALAPAHPVALNAKGGILHEASQIEEAVECYRAAIAAAPDYAAAHNNLGNAFKELGHNSDALASYLDALSANPDYPEARYNLATLYQSMGDLEAAIQSYESLLDAHPGRMDAWNGLESCLLYLHRPEETLEACRRCLAQDPDNQFSIANEAFAAMQMGDEARFDELYPLDRFPQAVEIQPPEPWADTRSLNEALARDVLSHPSLKDHHDEIKATTTRRFAYGILDQPTPAISAFADIVRSRVQQFIDTLPSSANHPFYSRPPTRWALKMWATVLNAGGIHGAHNHERAWLRGVYYVQGSGFIQDPENPRAGWIEFDGFSHLGDSDRFGKKTKLIEPRNGLMLFFPAYFLHGTVPFYSEDTRISIAFDVQPGE
jgi:tetratricopeptide (TPR) repeat protein